MRKNVKKNDTVRTTAAEAVAITLICFIAIAGIIFMKLAPYIGEHIVSEQISENEEPSLADSADDSKEKEEDFSVSDDEDIKESESMDTADIESDVDADVEKAEETKSSEHTT